MNDLAGFVARIAIVNREPRASSAVLAEDFQRTHLEILHAIRDLACSAEFKQRNFLRGEYRGADGRRYPTAWIGMDGFLLLSAGFTDARSVQVRERYRERFAALSAVFAEPVRKAPKPRPVVDRRARWRDLRDEVLDRCFEAGRWPLTKSERREINCWAWAALEKPNPQIPKELVSPRRFPAPPSLQARFTDSSRGRSSYPDSVWRAAFGSGNWVQDALKQAHCNRDS